MIIIYYFDKGKHSTLSMTSMIVLLIISTISVALVYYKSYKSGAFDKKRFLLLIFAILVSIVIFLKGLI